MSQKIIFGVIIISMLFHSRSNGAVFTVNGPDSTFTSIQPAIDSCSYNDTVLVYPGVYYENLVINLGITLASLYLIEQDPAYINETVIDGSGVGSCIDIVATYGLVVICGFTITHGNAESAGGGIYSGLASISIENCIIKDNFAGHSGGGIAAANGHIFLTDVTIFHNKANYSAGGALLAGSWTLMDPVNRCNIYENFAPHYCDLSFESYSYLSSIYLDTFTVVDPGSYFLRNHDSLDVFINYGKHEQIPADFFVSPEGDNSNSGTSPEEPLKNLWMALIKIRSDEDAVRSIFLAPGIYSPSTTEEKFPLGCKSNIRLKGISSSETILDGDSISNLFSINSLDTLIINDLTIRNGIGSRHYAEFSQVTGLMDIFNINFLKFKGVSLDHGFSSLAAVDIDNVINLVMDSTSIHDNYGSYALRIRYTKWSNSSEARHSIFSNCSFRNNWPSTGSFFGSGGAVIISEPYYDSIDEDRAEFINCEFLHNRTYSYPSAESTFPVLTMSGNGELFLVNCTLSENKAERMNDTTLIYLSDNVKTRMYNCIFFNNKGDDIWLHNYDSADDYDLEIYNSLFEHGVEKIIIQDTFSTLYYDGSNLSGDPMFTLQAEFPYSLQQGSPCVNAGTMNLPEGIALPQADLAGNPRIYNNSIDMGAYERNEWILVDERLNEENLSCGELTLFPNPFNSTATIKIVSSLNSPSELDLYTIDGRKLRSWVIEVKQGNVSEISWNGTDNQNNPLPSGYYIIRFSSSGRPVKSLGIIKY